MPLDHAPTAYKSDRILEPGIEPGTYCVLGSRHNQLDHSSRTSSEGLEPPISRFVVSRLIQLGHEDFSTLLLPVPPRDSIPAAGTRSRSQAPLTGAPPPKWFPDRDLNPGLNGESVVS